MLAPSLLEAELALPLAAEGLLGAAQVSARDERLQAAPAPADYSAVPRGGGQCARAAPQVWPQDGSAPVVVLPVLEQAGLVPGDSAPVVPQAGDRCAQAVQRAEWVQVGSVVLLPSADDLFRADLLPADSFQDDSSQDGSAPVGSALALASAVPQVDDSAELEQQAAHWQQAEPGGLPADLRAQPQAGRAAQQLAGSQACPSSGLQVSPGAPA